MAVFKPEVPRRRPPDHRGEVVRAQHALMEPHHQPDETLYRDRALSEAPPDTFIVASGFPSRQRARLRRQTAAASRGSPESTRSRLASSSAFSTWLISALRALRRSRMAPRSAVLAVLEVKSRS